MTLRFIWITAWRERSTKQAGTSTRLRLLTRWLRFRWRRRGGRRLEAPVAPGWPVVWPVRWTPQPAVWSGRRSGFQSLPQFRMLRQQKLTAVAGLGRPRIIRILRPRQFRVEAQRLIRAILLLIQPRHRQLRRLSHIQFIRITRYDTLIFLKRLRSFTLGFHMRATTPSLACGDQRAVRMVHQSRYAENSRSDSA